MKNSDIHTHIQTHTQHPHRHLLRSDKRVIFTRIFRETNLYTLYSCITGSSVIVSIAIREIHVCYVHRTSHRQTVLIFGVHLNVPSANVSPPPRYNPTFTLAIMSPIRTEISRKENNWINKHTLAFRHPGYVLFLFPRICRTFVLVRKREKITQ